MAVLWCEVTALLLLGGALLTSLPTGHGSPFIASGSSLASPSGLGNTSTRLVELATAPRVSQPTIMHQLRTVSGEDSDVDDGNDAAEELDGGAADTNVAKTNDDNDADEHDDYEDKADDYIDSLPLIMKKKQDNENEGRRKRRREEGLQSEAARTPRDSSRDWPETLPTPAAQSEGKATGYQRDDDTYVVEDSDGYPCVLAYFKAKITLYYPVEGAAGKEEYMSLVSSPPRSAVVSGTCDREAQDASLEITWKPGTFAISFAYDTLTDSWYVASFQFAFNTGNAAYVDSSTDQEVVVRSEEERRFWATSHARSFRCMLLHDIPLTSKEQRDFPEGAEKPRFSGTIHFDEVRVQALTYGDRFKTPKHCLHRVQRDETVPLIVGGTLAALTAVTIGVYAAIRYFKVKKVQYDTMQ